MTLDDSRRLKITQDDSFLFLQVESKEAGGMMTLDSIATAGFGVQTNSFNNPKNNFRVQALTLVGHPGKGSMNEQD